MCAFRRANALQRARELRDHVGAVEFPTVTDYVTQELGRLLLVHDAVPPHVLDEALHPREKDRRRLRKGCQRHESVGDSLVLSGLEVT
eukprot:scaffold5502_cov115-Isochrysis_galbana.AAC.8